MKNNNLFLIKLSDGSTVDASEIPGVKIEFFGKNNCITIEEGSVFSNLHIKMRENSQVTIEKTHSRGIRNTVIDMAGSSNNRLVIMKNCSIESCRFSMANESNLSIEIGEDCMFSSNVVFRATDGHVIYDINSKSLLNQAKPISIGNHVWLGSGVTILKGTKILDNTVIGTGSVVTKAFSESNIVIAGTPARVVKNNIGWDRTYIDSFKNHNKSERTENMLRTDNDKKEIFCKKYNINIDEMDGVPFGYATGGDPYRIYSNPKHNGSLTETIDIKVDKLYRFSNSLIQIANSLTIADQLGSKKIYLPKAWFFSSEIINISENLCLIANDSELLETSNQILQGNFFYKKTLKNLYPVTDEKQKQLDKLKPFFAFDKSTDPLASDHLVIHVRSGDLFLSGQPHPAYGQPPLAFYLTVIKSRQWSAVSIVSEDKINPVTDKIIKFCTSLSISCNLISGTLKSDIEFLLRSKTLVVGRGTFMPGVISLSDNIQEIFYFESGFTPFSTKHIKINKLEDIDGIYKSFILNSNWKNSVEQIEMMLDYPESAIGFVKLE